MTVSTMTTVHAYVGDGVQQEWPVLFPFFSPEDVWAIRTGTDGADAALVHGSDYTVTALESGGVCICPLGSGERLTLFLDLAPVQQIDLSNTGILAPEIIERGFDRLTLIAQQLKEEVGRCVQTGRTSGLAPNELLANIDVSVAACTAAQAASGQSAAGAATARDEAAASAMASAAAAASVALPVPDSAESGRGLVVAPEGGWKLGGSAAAKNVGTGPGDVPVNGLLPSFKVVKPQTIMEAPEVFLRQAGETVIVDDPSQVLAAHVSATGTDGTVSGSATYGSWSLFKAFDKSLATGLNFAATTGTVTYTFNEPRYIVGYKMGSTFAENWPVTRSPKNWTVLAGEGTTPDVVVDSQVNQSWASMGMTRDYMLANPLPVPVRSISFQITANNGDANYCGICEIDFLFGRAVSSENAVVVEGGVRLALADGNGSVEEFVTVPTAVPLEMDGDSPAAGQQFILAGPDGGRAVLVPPVYDIASGRWSDTRKQAIVGCVQVAGYGVTALYQCRKGAVAELVPLGTTLPNPFIHLPVMATQGATVCPVVNNQVTGVTVGGAPVRVWRMD